MSEKPAANVAKRKSSPEKEMARARALRSEHLTAYDNKQPEERGKRDKQDGLEEEDCEY